MNDHSTTNPVDESWVAHLRDLSTGVEPPTSANPHAMSRVAIRRTRTRRAVLATGGGVLTVAAVAGAAIALGGPTAPGVLLPGGSPVSSASSSTSAEERRAREVDLAAREALEQAKSVPDGWHAHELEGLTYALPPEIVTSGPVQDEPGVTSHMWHSSEDPDVPPFLRIAYYDEGSETPSWPSIADKPGGKDLSLPGARRAVAHDVSAEAAGLPDGSEVPDDMKGPTMFVLEPTSGPGAYVITLNLAQEGATDFVKAFQSTLTLH
ncbi:hypothetical protein [Promicromonospora sp. NPDC060271]|uniref:hypothetical protein n=1 Tax=Promicromonospora sp. NPDC060271 TaxID=3347089 RepID=UPI0036688DC4